MYKNYVICVLLWLKLKNKKLHIHRAVAIILLWVFSLAVTPWAALHHHAEVLTDKHPEKNCTHKLHLKAQEEACLLCNVHFEKNYIVANYTLINLFLAKKIALNNLFLRSSFAKLISTSLRGPPVSA